MSQCDCVVAFGAGLNYFKSMTGNILCRRSLIQSDADPARIGLQYAPGLALIGDAAARAQLMIDQLEHAELEPKAFLRVASDRDPRADFTGKSGGRFLDMRTATIVLDQLLPEARIVVTDGGGFVPVPGRYLLATSNTPSTSTAPHQHRAILLTGAINSSFWPYYEVRHEPWPIPLTQASTPTAYASFPREIRHPTRSSVEGAFNIQRWTQMERGGHFAGLEAPDALASDVATYSRRWRQR